jgi:hypothetical protein
MADQVWWYEHINAKRLKELEKKMQNSHFISLGKHVSDQCLTVCLINSIYAKQNRQRTGVIKLH